MARAPEIQHSFLGQSPRVAEFLESCALSPTPVVAAKRKFSAAQRFEIPQCTTEIGSDAEKRDGAPAAADAFLSSEPQRRRKLAVVAI